MTKYVFLATSPICIYIYIYMQSYHTMLKPEQLISADDAVSRAMSMTTVYLGEALLRQEGLLLPDVHNSFIQEINTHVSTDREQCFMARWVLSNLKTSLQHHLNYVCKIGKCGTLLYRSNGDVLVALTKLMHCTRFLDKKMLIPRRQ